MSKRIFAALLAAVMCLGLYTPAALAADDGADSGLVEGSAVYDQVLDTYEQQFQDSVRFKADGSTNVTGEEWKTDSETVGVNRERAHAQFVPYQSAEVGLQAEKSVLDNVGRDTSTYYQLLSGKDWDFALVKNPAEAAKKDAAYLAENYAGPGFAPEHVPQAWQTYRNTDGTFTYFDEPMYLNHPFPWLGNFEAVDYENPSAPTVYNPVGYYRTTFQTPAEWDGREIFLSLQSVESAYYLYINGKCVGYSTDSFTAHDFDLSSYLKPAGQTNTLAIKIFRWSIGSWLENQDFIRQSGIYRDVYLYSKGEAEIQDFFVKTAFKDRTSVDSDVDVSIETTVRGLRNAAEGTYTVSAYLVDDADKTVVTAADQSVTIAASGAKTPEQKLTDTGTKVTTSFLVPNPKKWFSDTPNLYRLVLQLKKGNSVIETAVQRIGFREVYKTILDANKNNEQIQITGEILIFRGTNRHDTDLETGHAVTFEGYKKDLMLMKQTNINAIRTSHYPNDRVLFDLADELGIYVCAEANVESHRASMNGINVPTGINGSNGLPEWVPPVLDRTATMTEQYKNNTSVVIWSLGNEATYSKPKLTNQYSFWVASMYLLARDPSRIRKYEREENRGYIRPAGTDPWSLDARKNQIIDVASSQYSTPASAMGYNGQIPFIHSEYNHAMGQAYGNAKEHWDAIRATDNVQGGFIWDWIDQSILTTKDSNGDGVLETFWGYGGDWIDSKVNDNAFCGNGIAYADHTPGPMTLEARKVHQQVSFYQDAAAVPGENLAVQVVNEFENTALSTFNIAWKLTEDGKTELGTGTLNLTTPAVRGLHLANTAVGGNVETVSIPLPAFTPKEGSDYLLDISVTRKESKPWAEAGEELAYEQFQLAFAEESPITSAETAKDFTSVEEKGNFITLTGTTDVGQTFSIKLDTAMGQLVEYALDGKVIMTAGPEFSLWHPQTYNESGYSTWSLPLQNAGNPLNLTNLTVDVDKSTKNKVSMITSGSLKVDADSAMTLEIYGNGEIVVYEQFVPKSNFAPQGLPKVGTRMTIAKDYGNFNWYGRGPWETYSDRKSGARVGTYSSTVDEQYDMKLLKPQENGNHTDVRWTSLINDAGAGLLVSAGNGNVLEVSALHNTAEEINSGTYNNADHRHPVDIKQREDITWSIDLRQDGVGDTGFSTPYPIAKYKIYTDKSYSYSYRISPISKASDSMAISKKPFTTPTAEYQVSSIAVNGTAIPSFSPIAREFTYEIPVNASSVVVTAESTGEVSINTNPSTGTVTVTSINSKDEVEAYTIHMVRAKKQMPNTAFSKAVTHNNASGNPAQNLIDGDISSFWDFNWSGEKTWDMSELYYAVELATPTKINSVGYIPRQDAQTNGNFQSHEIYTSTKPISELNIGTGLKPNLESSDWTMVSSGTWDTGKGWKDDVFPLTAEPVKTILVQPRSTANSPAPPSSSYGCGAETRVSAPLDASLASIVMEPSYAMVGNAAEPDPAITVAGTKLIRGVDYTVAYKDNSKVGTATATISYKGQFYGADVVKEFKVTAPNAEELVFGIFLNGAKLDDFVYTTDSYTYSLPFGTTDMAITATVADGAGYTVEMGNDGAVLTATKGAVTKTYTIKMTRQAPPDKMGGTATFASAAVHDSHSASTPANMYDQKESTYWENSWTPQTVKEAYVALELKTPMMLSDLQYLPRQESGQQNGRFLEHEIYVSTKPLSELIVNDYPTAFDSGDWVLAGQGTWAADNTWKNTVLGDQSTVVKTVLVQPVTTDSKDGHPNSFGCVAEISVKTSTNATNATVTLDAAYPLANGKATPDPVIMMGGIRLLRGVDYTVAYANNTEVGKTATATITYQGVYTGTSVEKTFTVGKESTVLTSPTGLAWDSAVSSKATWGAVEHASGYSVQLFKNSMPQGNAFTVTGTEKNFTGIISGSGSYTFKVKALGDGADYSDSALSAASPTYTYVADYTVRLAPGAGYTLQAVDGSKSPVAEGGSFRFTLTVADSHSQSAPQVKVNGIQVLEESKKDNVYTYALSDIRENKSVTVADLAKNIYTITFTADDKPIAERKVEYGGSLTLNNFPDVPERPGYTGTWEQKVAISNVTANLTVAAVYEPGTYTVIFDLNGGDSVSQETMEVTFGQPYAELPSATYGDDTKRFDGWFIEAEAGAKVSNGDSVRIPSDHTLYAHWRDASVSASPNTNVTGMPEKVTLPYTEEGITLTASEGATYTYQWKRSIDGGETWKNLDGETEQTYTIPAEDVLLANSGWQYLCSITNTEEGLTPSSADSQTMTLTVVKGFCAAPVGLKGVPPTSLGGTDGQIEGLDSNKLYAYKKSGSTTYTKVAEGSTTISDLSAGTYQVRYAETDDCMASADTPVTVPEYTPILVTTVALDQKNVTLYLNSGSKTVQLKATVSPEDADDKAITWASDKPDVASVDENGLVTIHAEGAAVITVTTHDGNFTDTCNVTVTTYSSGGGGGGGGSSSDSTTEENEDGSTTKTVTNKATGTVTETTTWPNGDKEVVTTTKDGTITETLTKKDGYKSELVTKPDGSFTGKTTDSAGVIVDTVGSTTGEVTAKVTLPKNMESAKVTVPVKQSTPGTVAVIVKPDGTEELVKASVLTEDGMKLAVDGNAEIKLIDNSKRFSDVKTNDWFSDSVQFAASREIFQGTDVDTFSPNAPMTRSMLVTVLARFDGQDTTGGDTWYSKAKDWGMAQGITNGSDMESNITRESLVVMLYRYAKADAAQGVDLSKFPDRGAISDWAAEAMSWAVSEGILSGSGEGKLNPGAAASRAEVATILERFVASTL